MNNKQPTTPHKGNKYQAIFKTAFARCNKQLRLWITQLGMWLFSGLIKLPYPVQMKLGAFLGEFIYRLAKERRQVTERNVELCFPELQSQEQRALVKKIIINNAIGMFETGMAWWAPKSWFSTRYRISGQEHLEAALAKGKGVILMGAHFSTLDLGGLLFSFEYTVSAMYRRHNNAVLEKIITAGRARYFEQSIERSDIRSVIRSLRQNKIIWYAPDQDMGSKQSVYAPFFGVPAATITATSRMVKLNNSPILMLAQHRLDDCTYEMEIFPAIEPFPTGDDVNDATLINAEIEKAIRKDPSQYMWVHRRFKTHPQGKNYLYR